MSYLSAVEIMLHRAHQMRTLKINIQRTKSVYNKNVLNLSFILYNLHRRLSHWKCIFLHDILHVIVEESQIDNQQFCFLFCILQNWKPNIHFTVIHVDKQCYASLVYKKHYYACKSPHPLSCPIHEFSLLKILSAVYQLCLKLYTIHFIPDTQ